MGTAAYKTVELDDYLGQEPVQHREVQGYESELFLSYFKAGIKLLSGGVDSGFKHVAPAEYKPRLMHVKGKKKVRVMQVDIGSGSLNSGDVFILDCGLTIYQWNGSQCGPMEKQKGAAVCRALKEERKSGPNVIVVEEADKGVDADNFWKGVGGRPAKIKTADEGGKDDEEVVTKCNVRRLWHLSDASGKMEFKQVAEGNKVSMSLFNHDDVMIFDAGFEVFAWIGKGANAAERANGIKYAEDMLKNDSDKERVKRTPISRVLDGQESPSFKQTINS
jgi:hypothetical protein